MFKKVESICGTNDSCAKGKIEIGLNMLKDNDISSERTLLIGDTLHDADVAETLNVRVILYSGGHNSFDVLQRRGIVIKSLNDLFN